MDYVCTSIGTEGLNKNQEPTTFIRNINLYPELIKEKAVLKYWDNFTFNENFNFTDKGQSYVGIKETKTYKYPYKLDVFEDGYLINVKVPWEYIDVNVFRNKELWFDLEVSFSDINGDKQRTLLALSNLNYSGWFDPTFYANTELL